MLASPAKAATEYKTQAPSQWWCPYGAVCFYDRDNGLGNVCYSYGDVPVSSCSNRRSYFNNGAPCNNCDHVRLYWQLNYGTAVGWTCLHYGWTEGRGNWGGEGFHVGSYRWGGEC
ncbi:hypothetical protein Psuf_003420 [Phytohabitans suffuscus]|uniref:Peptidase inhibitor family I36 n=1 Tax=Phytohabitans suffuscus TaxID=624315 RepID=A0A6F8YAH1_9ACTN|nr:hypothetical protein Psuf_003420 [Phytohabitans suffuscus]